jgi:uncharacterized protein
MKKIIIIPILLILVAVIYAYINNFYKPKITINGYPIYLELAITPDQITQGLSYRKKLDQNTGMLFVFGNSDFRPFWMKEMKFPLDFIWLDGNKIVDLSKNIPILTDNAWTVVRPNYPVNRVLELNAGTIDKLHITTESSVLYNK